MQILRITFLLSISDIILMFCLCVAHAHPCRRHAACGGDCFVPGARQWPASAWHLHGAGLCLAGGVFRVRRARRASRCWSACFRRECWATTIAGTTSILACVMSVTRHRPLVSSTDNRRAVFLSYDPRRLDRLARYLWLHGFLDWSGSDADSIRFQLAGRACRRDVDRRHSPLDSREARSVVVETSAIALAG